jgi:hypothetical protein
MDAAENHYATTGWVSPMVFLSRNAFEGDTHVYQLVNETANSRYQDMLFITDEPNEVVQFL